MRWIPAEPPAASDGALPTSWLIVGDRGELDGALADALRARGEHCVLVSGSDVGLAGVLQRHLAQASETWRVVYLAGLDDGGDERTSGGALRLVQALAGVPGAAGRLWLVTRGAQSAAAGPTAGGVRQAPLWGLGRTIAAEYPDLWGGLIDLDPAQPAGAASVGHSLVEAIATSSGETHLALRAGRRLAPRLVRHRPSGAPPPVAADATYLITGGLGALGLHLARWLVERGARSLVLLGRRPPTAAGRATLAALQEAGAGVRVVSADVAVEHQVGDALAHIAAAGPPLKGIFHAAGVLDDGVLARQTWERFAAVLAPKVAGAWHLHALTQALPLDFFVLFSSAAALLGAAGQASYAAANAFLDALAHHRRARGLPALSINWGPWAGGGMAARLEDQGTRRWMARGMSPLPPERALDRLGALLGGHEPQVAVMQVDWAAFGRGATGDGARTLFAGFVGQSEQDAPPGAFRRRLEAVAPGDWDRLLVGWLQEQVAGVLGLDAAQARALPPQQGLFDLGMDSLMAVELRNRLQAGLGQPLSETFIFNYATVEDLAEFFRRALRPEDGPPTPPAPWSPAATVPSTTAPPADGLAQLSERELGEMLDAELADLLANRAALDE